MRVAFEQGPAPRPGLLSLRDSSVSVQASLASASETSLGGSCKTVVMSNGALVPVNTVAVNAAKALTKFTRSSSRPVRRATLSALSTIARLPSAIVNALCAPAKPAPSGPWALPQLCHETVVTRGKVPAVSPVYVHPYPCPCEVLDGPCSVAPSSSDLEMCALLELSHDLPADKPCRSTAGTMYHQKHGLAKCVEVELWSLRQDCTPFADTFGRDFFRGSPQEHAVLNRHLLDYFKGRDRAQRTTPYNIPNSQLHILAPLGMEEPQPDAPEAQHALHKCIEEHQLHRMSQYLPSNAYGLISVKDSKLHILPTPASVQNPVHQAKDVSRYPGSGLRCAKFSEHDLYFMHDVSSEVGPHEIVERIAAENSKAHVFVTGINPIEVVDRAGSFEPASHEIDYDLSGFNYVFTGSESEAYFTPVATTVSWLRTSSVRASTGDVYQVVLLDYKLGHCIWHVFRGDVPAQESRTFPTGSYIRIPAVLTGTWADEWIPAKMVTNILAFTDRTPDLSSRNIAAKVSQLATSITPRLTSKELWIAQHLALERAPLPSLWSRINRGFWRSIYAVTFQWHLLAPRPDVYSFVDERRRFRVLHPTRGGGWSDRAVNDWRPDAIPNNPTWLMRLSAFTTSVFTFILPKVLIGEVVANVFMHVPLGQLLGNLARWADLQPLRLALTAAIIVVTAILPGHVVKVFTRLSGHMWRQLWLPGWFSNVFQRTITEICGGPGARILSHLPGRGWFMQAYIWTIGVHTILPGLVPSIVIPWFAVTSGWWPLLLLWYLAIGLENFSARRAADPYIVPEVFVSANIEYDIVDWWNAFVLSELESFPSSLHFCSFHSLSNLFARLRYRFKLAINVVAMWQVGVPSGRSGFTPLARRTTVVDTVVRHRNVDKVLPTVTLLPNRIPAALGAPALAIDPLGMRFHEWLDAVKQAYAVEPTRYPLLTPGQSCFWDCVSSLGGTNHMWYSWFMAFTGGVPDPAEVVGQVSQADMLKFSSASRIGVSMSGSVTVVTQSQDSFPVLNMICSYHAVAGLYHVELSTPLTLAINVASFAKLLCTVRNVWPAWFVVVRDAIATSAVDSVPVFTPACMAMMGNAELPNNRNSCVDALVGSYSCVPIDPRAQGGYSVNFTAAHNMTDTLVEFNAPVARSRFGTTDSKTIWARFRIQNTAFRVKVPEGYTHPIMEPAATPKIGSSHAADRSWRNNQAPQPARWTELRNDLIRVVQPYIDVTLPAVALNAQRFEYTADVQRASRLVADLRAHPSVLESFNNPQVIQSLDAIVDTWRASGKSCTKPVVAYFGVWGSGKTTATMGYMANLSEERRRQTRVVSHTESLRAQSKLALDFPALRGFNFPTLASIITEPSTGPVVFDDAGKFWGGMLDLVMLCNPLVDEIVLNGDPAQGLAQFPVAGTQSQFDANPLSAVAHLITEYATITHRGFRLLADTLGVHTTNVNEGHITHTVAPKIGLPVLTSSPRYAGVLISSGRQAYTFSSVQGEDFKTDVEVDMTALEDAVLDRSAYVGLTRSKTGCYVHMSAMDANSQIRAPPTASDLMNGLIYAVRQQGGSGLKRPDAIVKAAFYRHLHTAMPALPWFAKFGSSIPRQDFQNVFPATETHRVAEAIVVESHAADAVQAVAPAIDGFIPETHWHAKEDREVSGRGGSTDQFKETAFVNPHDHKRKDTSTYFLSVQKRLKTMSAKANARRMARCKRLDMCDEFDKLVPHPPKWSAMKHAEYCDLTITEYESHRTKEAVYAKLDAHDPDRTGSDIKISLKNQVIKKDEKRHKKEAIPGQLIHEYDIGQTLSDAPYALFLENELFDAFPSNFLFYRRMNPQQFIDAYKKQWRVGNGVHTSDVTRWDVGCDAGVLNFDVHVMHRCSFPVEYIKDYIVRRLSSRSQHGPMATMQNSGDRYTWSLNSIRRAVVASIINEVTPEDTVAINGDDEAIDRFCDSKHFPDSPWIFKNLNGDVGDFSGFELGGVEPKYSAEGINYRSLILESRDPSAQDKWQNYLGLLAWADLDDPMAMDVAIKARKYMKPDLFWQALPKPLHSFF